MRYTWKTGIRELLMLATAVVFLVPFVILVNIAIRPANDLSSPLAPTQNPTLDNFVTAWNRADLGAAILNSVLVTVISVTLIVFISAAAAYPLARLTSRLPSTLFYLFMVGLLLPLQLGMIPLYAMMRDLGLLGSLIPLILLYTGIRLPFSLFINTAFLRQLPIDYEEAASIDGCGPWGTLRYVVFPLLRPATGTVVILNGLFVWNDFLSPLLYLTGSPNQTVPVAIYSFVGETPQWEVVFAGLVISALPVLAAFVFLQQRLIQGFAGGLKG